MKNIFNQLLLLLPSRSKKDTLYKYQLDNNGGPNPPMTPAEKTHLEAYVLAQRDCTPRERKLNPAQYDLAVAAVDEVVRFFRPSGSHRTEVAMNNAITAALKPLGLTQEDYWAEVWRMNGCKCCMSYNKRGKQGEHVES